ncbi:Transcriptional regulatory protein YycF [compost metagenome]
MRKAKIVVVEGDPELRRLLSFWLAKIGPVATSLSSSGTDGFRLAQEILPDLIVADAELSGMDGFLLVRRLRAIATFLDTPIVMLTRTTAQKYQAFEAGADDVLTKPIDALEFQYRLQAHLRPRFRRLAMQSEPVEAGPAQAKLKLDPRTHTVELGETKAELTPSEYAILCYLAAHAEAPATTQTLLVDALGMAPGLGNPQLVHTHIRNLRRKLEKTPSKPELLLFARRGYWLKLPEA